jgi:hypothetical protein
MNPPTRTTRGFTLAEMSISIGMITILFAATQSALTLARKLGQTPILDATNDAAAALDQLAAHAACAKSITLSADLWTITLVVADINGNGTDDTLVYSYNGTTGTPMTLSINGSTPAAVTPPLSWLAVGSSTFDASIPAIPTPPSALPQADFSLLPCTTGSTSATVLSSLSIEVLPLGSSQSIGVTLRALNTPAVP